MATSSEIQALFAEAECFRCNSNASLADLLKLALLDRISESASGGPGGSDTQVQFNDGGVFGGDADLTWNKTTNLLTVVGNVNATTFLGGNGALATPTFAFTSDANTGIYRVGEDRLGFVNGGSLRGEFNGATFELKAAIPLVFNGVTFLRGDDTANTISQRNGVSAQVYHLYRTFTNSTNYERLALQSAAGQFILASETAGTGTDNIDLVLTPAGTGLVNITTAATADAAVVSTHTARVKFNGTEFKVLLATP